MNEIYEKYGKTLITEVISDYILGDMTQEEIAYKLNLNQWSDVSPIIRGCNFNEKRSNPFQEGKSKGIYAYRNYPLKNGQSIKVTKQIVDGFVWAWGKNPNLMFSDYMESTYDNQPLSGTIMGTTMRPTSGPTSEPYPDPSTLEPMSSDEVMAIGCVSVVCLIAAFFLLPKIPLIGGLFGSLFNMIKQGVTGGFFALAYMLAPFGELIAAVGLIVIFVGKFITKGKNTARMGGVSMCSGMALMALPRGDMIVVLVLAGIAAGLYVTRKK